ncbi:MAG: hypothetical protein HYU64_02045 [Armatimonadetes bacterium]|nr:hypothetical protein [Armatimonadota bacterium]
MEKIQKTSEHQERDPERKAREKYNVQLEELEERIAPKKPTTATSCGWLWR